LKCRTPGKEKPFFRLQAAVRQTSFFRP